MPETNKTRTKKYRSKLRATLGDEAYKALEAKKRRERRAKLRAKKNKVEKAKVIHTEEYKDELKETITTLKEEVAKPKLPLPEVRVLIKEKAQIAKVRGAENCEDLLEQVYKAKLEYNSSLDNPKKISKKTVAQQLTKVVNLRKYMLGGEKDCSDFDFLKDTDKVIDFINTSTRWKTANSKNSQLQAISSIIVALDGFDPYYNIYSKASTKGRKEINAKAGDNLTTEKEKENILPWSDLKDLTKKKMNATDRALIGIYTLLPPRRVEDVSLLTLTDTDKNLSNTLNYIRLTKKGEPLELIYLRYKTDKTYGRVNVDIPDDLAEIFKKQIKAKDLKTGDPLFPNQKGTYYKGFSALISATFKKYTKKAVSANLIRHSYISDFPSVPRSTNAKKLIAEQMGHSIAMQSGYDRLDL